MEGKRNYYEMLEVLFIRYDFDVGFEWKFVEKIGSVVFVGKVLEKEC